MSKPDNGRRQPMQIYVPRHRRVAQQQQDVETTPTTMSGRLNYNNNEQQSRMSRENTSSPVEVVVRRGRGQFRAPISTYNNNNNNNTTIRDNHWNGGIDSNNNSNKSSNYYHTNNRETSSVSPSPSNIQNHYNRPTPPSSPPTLNNNNNNIQQQQQKEVCLNESLNTINDNNNNSNNNSRKSNETRYNPVDQLTTTMKKLNVTTSKEDIPCQINVENDNNSISSISNDESSEKEEWEYLLETLDKEEDEQPKKQQQQEEKPLKNNVPIIIPEKKSTNLRSSSSSSPPSSPSSINDNNNTHILDCFGFPSSFKTYHLQSMFSKYDTIQGGYKIKWMDDTRALLIFAHSQTAKRAYLDNINNSQIKIRPYTGGIEFSESSEGQPIPRRPATTDMVARRLINGALGVRGPTRTAEQREKERALLQAERDRREAKKRKEAERSQAISDAFNE